MLNKEKLRNYLLKYTQHKRFGGFGKVPGAHQTFCMLISGFVG